MDDTWRDWAACLNHWTPGDDPWFPEPDNSITAFTNNRRRTLRICTEDCAVMLDCRDWAESLTPSRRNVGMIAGGRYYRQNRQVPVE